MQGHGWTNASELKVGDKVRLEDGATGTVEKAKHVKLDIPVTVYNFEVEDFHTYYVSEQKVLVHNTCAMTEKNLSTNRKAEILRENRIRGAAYEKEKYAEFSKVHSHSAEQVTIRTASGTKIRVDAIGYDAEGKLVIQEFKSSQSAGFTKNQKRLFLSWQKQVE